MAFRVVLNGITVECDTPDELRKLVALGAQRVAHAGSARSASAPRSTAPPPPKPKPPSPLERFERYRGARPPAQSDGGGYRLDEKTVARIHELAATGASLRSIAKAICVDRGTVQAYVGPRDHKTAMQRHWERRKAKQVAPMHPPPNTAPDAIAHTNEVLRQIETVRNELLDEKARLESRLTEIHDSLAGAQKLTPSRPPR